MNNLLSYFGLVDATTSASLKNSPVLDFCQDQRRSVSTERRKKNSLLKGNMMDLDKNCVAALHISK